jgi:DNA-binding protein H-NS
MMAKPNLSKMDVESLMDLRKRVDELLLRHRTELEKQRDRMEGASSSSARFPIRKRKSKLKGRKVPPKYRSPSGDTWAGRGARPRWLVAAMKKGSKKLDAFLIDKSGRKRRKKRKTKR